jgi:hypothetical protein
LNAAKKNFKQQSIFKVTLFWFLKIGLCAFDKSAASFCRQAPEWVPDMFSNFCFMNNPEFNNKSTTTKTRIKTSTDLKSLEFFVCLLDCI